MCKLITSKAPNNKKMKVASLSGDMHLCSLSWFKTYNCILTESKLILHANILHLYLTLWGLFSFFYFLFFARTKSTKTQNKQFSSPLKFLCALC